ncbi:M23 family metallopeptidase [Deinococcus arenicola]|uniref:M23 family metallopeptidase n=1 Tax=Deinococcus arenicola TaxID=2994950 RepID=A0ABU4DVI6_9DEIO|nr:M23 family metallopeptidase [Deinococcus sp. ZS9-10]MDV6375694.1 M23 family metallopeptidase [Deinococcus sp. ZS9-10]
MKNVFRTALCAALWGLTITGGAGAATAYRVQSGDTLSQIAARSGLSVAQVQAANPKLKGKTSVQAGWVLTLPARPGAASTYRVRSGDNLSVIARRSGLTLTQLLRANPQYAGGKAIQVGATVRIPARSGVTSGATASRTPAAAVRSASTSGRGDTWLWPLGNYQTISSGFGERTLEGSDEMHYGVDIVAPLGTLVRAARAGQVLESRPDYARGWGWTVVIEHPDGWITRYAHLSANLVRKGENVNRGQSVGRVGNTGRSTGPHLHFGTYLRWSPRNPLGLY